MTNLLVSGISGKVGNYIKQYAHLYNFSIVCGIDKNCFIEADFPVYKTFSEVKEQVDLIIDFSSAALTEQAIEFATSNNCKLVCGTTALTKKAIKAIENLSHYNAVCLSENFSLGINVFIEALKLISTALPEFDTSLSEYHNKNKKDAPSGTAKKIIEECKIQQVVSIRGGNVAGVHSASFLGNGEEVTVTHRVYDKSVFAIGALKCANKLLEKEKGLFTPSELV